MAKLTFLAGVAAGYVLGARAGKQRYAQIKRLSTKVWTSGPVERKKADLAIAARTKAAPYVADLVSDAAKAAGQKMRESGSTVPKHLQAVTTVDDAGYDEPRSTGTDG